MVHTTGGIAVGRGTEIVEGRRRPLRPDWRVYDLLKVGKEIDILHPKSIRFENQMKLKSKKRTADFCWNTLISSLISAILDAAWSI